MTAPVPSPHLIRIGEWHVDLKSGDLTGNGTHVRLQLQSLELLKALLERRGTMVAREELRQRLWPNDTFVDFDHGLNAAVRRLREALGDSADSPRFVETIPRRGYRLVATTDVGPAAAGLPALAPGGPAPATNGPAVSRPQRRPYLGLWFYVMTAVVILTAFAVGAWRARTPSIADRPAFATLRLDVPVGWTIERLDQIALSPDNRVLAFTAVGPEHVGSLWLRPLTGSARQIPGTDGAMAPFWSPDSSQVGFFSHGNLKALTVADGRVQLLGASAPPPVFAGAAAWIGSGDILFMPLGTALGTPVHAASMRRLNPITGDVVMVSSSQERRDYLDYLAPQAIPRSSSFTFVRWNPSTLEMTGHVGDVASSRVIDLGRVDSRIAITTTGHAVFLRRGTLVAQEFDSERRTLTGVPIPLAQDVAVLQPMLGHFAVNADLIAYLPRSALGSSVSMTVVDRRGAVLRRIGDVAEYSTARVSPDGTRLAVAQRDPISGTRDIWVHDLVGTTLPIRLTSHNMDDMSPAWSADSRSILFTSDRSGERDIYRKEIADGRPEAAVFSSADSKSLNSWSPDGRVFIFDTGARGAIDSHGKVRKDLFMVSLSDTPTVQPLATTPAAESNADISPDGRLVAYQSTGTQGSALFVETFPHKGLQFRVPMDGEEPMWRADGRELFFLSPRGELCAIEVDRSGDTIRFGQPRALFKPQKLPNVTRRYAPLPDGQSFVVLTTTSGSSQDMTVLVNWRSALPE